MAIFAKIFGLVALAFSQTVLALPEPQITTAPDLGSTCFSYTTTVPYIGADCTLPSDCGPAPACIILLSTTLSVPCANSLCTTTPTVTVASATCPTCRTGCETTVETATVTTGC